ncbi:MAG: hypothetical protein NT133_01575 [Alphaproteobacteria bacterium]|nr:hypothetical protein [Alphaproteobacteria bacterium]
MKKDWFATFLPLWMWGSIVWIAAGLYLLPTSFQRAVFGSSHGVYIGRAYDMTAIDYEVLWQFMVVLGTPNILFLVVFTIAGYQHIRSKPAKRDGPVRA